MAGTPFWDPGAFGPPPPSDPDRGQPIRTSLPENGEDLQGVSPWEVIYFAGQRAPGICRVDGGKRRIVDPRWIPGSSGEIPTVMMVAPATFTVTLTLWTPAQLAAFVKLVELLFPRPTPPAPPTPAQQFNTPVVGPQAQSQFPNSPAQPIFVPNSPLQSTANAAVNPLQAVDVQHPAFASLHVTSVFCVDVTAPRHVGYQIMEAVIDCVEFRTPTYEGVRPFTSSVDQVSPGIYAPPGGGGAPATRQQQPPLDPSRTDIGSTAGGPP